MTSLNAIEEFIRWVIKKWVLNAMFFSGLHYSLSEIYIQPKGTNTNQNYAPVITRNA